MRRYGIISLLSLVLTVSASAQATRTWVSGVGDDVNPCSRTAPCKTWAGAISKTAAGGEINALDPGGFGALTITKSITIDGGGTFASALSTGTSGFTINGDSNTVVTIRNVSINGGNSTFGSGIRVLVAKAVNIENVKIINYAGTGSAGRGIDISSSTANLRVNVRNVDIFNTGSHGIASTPTAGNVILTVDHSRIHQGGLNGITLTTNSKATITNSVLTGFAAGSAVLLEASTVEAFIENSVLSNSQRAVVNGGGIGGSPTCFLSKNLIAHNTVDGLLNVGGSITSFGNNVIRSNAGNQTPTATIGTT